jgi:hypothetical protein
VADPAVFSESKVKSAIQFSLEISLPKAKTIHEPNEAELNLFVHFV